jgi:glycosyltransferase involved in cell wall biosynthesis
LGASSRVRSLQYVPRLKVEGIEVSHSPLFPNDYVEGLYSGAPTNWVGICRDYSTRIRTLLGAKTFDVLWIEKELFPGIPAWFELALTKYLPPYVVDFDDAFFHKYGRTPYSLTRLLHYKFDDLMRAARVVICGNDYVAAHARSIGASKVVVIPTAVDLTKYKTKSTERHSPTVVGWIGTPKTVKYLDMLRDSLLQVAEKLPFQLRVVGAKYAVRGLDVECREWSEAQEGEEILQFDVGVMPLPDSPWERGKSGYKLIQYMACALPVIASPVGVNSKLVRHGVNGFHASSPTDWTLRLVELCADANLRAQMGIIGRKLVEELYCTDVTAPLLAQTLRDVPGT